MVGLALHPGKTRYIVFGSDTDLPISLKGQSITRVHSRGTEKSFRLLGVHFSQGMKWDCHIEQVIGKIKGNICCLARSKKSMNRNARIAFFYAHIFSHISYCFPIWGSQGVKNALLNKLYKKALRHVINQKNRIHTPEICQDLGILPFKEALEHSLRLAGHKIYNDPGGLDKRCDRSRGADRCLLKTPLNYGYSNTLCEIVGSWNSLPQILHPFRIQSYLTFKRE